MKRLTLLFLFVAGAVSLLSAQQWTLSGPQSRHSHTAVYDPSTAQMIIFGGQQTANNTDLNDVWVGATNASQDDGFTQVLPTGTLPAGRFGHVATYDPNTNRMTVFGGAEGMPAPCANDVWILDGADGDGTSTWIPITASGTLPAARVYSAGVYDPTTNSLIVFGGNNCSTTYFNDVWVLSNANGEGGTPKWTQLTPSGTAPVSRESASAVYDSVNNIMTLFGGDAGSASFGDVWTLSHANGTGGTPTWTKLNPTGTAPSARTGQTGTLDPSTGRMTIFGGIAGGLTLTDSWVLLNSNGLAKPSWQPVTTTGTAPSIAYHSAVYDQNLNDMFAFAGSSSADKLSTNSHAFTLFGANGVAKGGNRWILGGPAVRYSQSAFYDTVTNSLFVFGGQHSKTNLDFADYWQASNVVGSSNLKWTVLHPGGPTPSPRFGHTGLYDPGTNRMMVFAGATGYPSPCVNDYHILEFANQTGGTSVWATIKPSGTPPPIRSLHVSAYDSASNTLMIFGGYDCKSTYYNDVWVLSHANNSGGTPAWTQLRPTGTAPNARESSAGVYDATANELIIFGGNDTNRQYNDIWILSHANGTGGTPAWTQLTPAGHGPGARSGISATYDPASDRMTIYGGYNGSGVLSEVWILTGASGTNGTASWTQDTSGQPRRFPSSLYDASPNLMITFGGETSTNPLNPSSDIYTLTNPNGLK